RWAVPGVDRGVSAGRHLDRRGRDGQRSGEHRLLRRSECLMKILIADDGRVMRQIVTRTLRQAGFDGHDLVEAADGQEAFDMAMSEKPDLVLSDWNMPQLTGVEVLRQLRANGVQVPFGFITSEGSPE